MKLKELESALQPLKGFGSPKRELEQYVTSAHLASRMLFTAESSFGDIEDKKVLDLGCGCAVLAIASVMMGASSVLGVDADMDALEIAKANVAEMEMEDEVTLVQGWVGDGAGKEVASFSPEDGQMFDTVVTNPPFGTWIKGADMVFLEVACQLATTAVYSLNKTSTRDFIMKKAKTLGFSGEVIAQMRYDLPKTYAHHKSKSVDIEVDMWRFERLVPKQ